MGKLIDYAPDGTVTEYDYPDPPGPRVITPREFMDRLSPATQAAIAAAATNSGQIMLLLIRLNGGDVRLDADETKAGVAAMQAAKLITAAEAAALLA